MDSLTRLYLTDVLLEHENPVVRQLTVNMLNGEGCTLERAEELLRKCFEPGGLDRYGENQMRTARETIMHHLERLRHAVEDAEV